MQQPYRLAHDPIIPDRPDDEQHEALRGRHVEQHLERAQLVVAVQVEIESKL